ncbi:hypothetical protein [Desertivirga arenae]|uniref:hypothetical protein n=1 Tax=Desertivirga arenae TaxID=2810309 RepID=UPI001A96BF09|nr:hypothetical protein [Pedobacter sp. SYSU D00823]
MKTFKNIYVIFLAAVCFIASCSKKEYELGSLPDKSDLKFEVKQDLQKDPGGNTVILVNNTPETTPVWNYGTGKSYRQRDTIRFAFKGNYTVKFSAVTGAGIVEGDSIIVKVTQDNLQYVNDPLWTALSGGPGNEKTWILDIKAQYFDGPLFFYGTNNGWLQGGNSGCYGADCWNWSPDYKGNTWLMENGDYGTMTFSLKGGPFVKSTHLKLPSRGTENGTYYLDKDAKTLTLSGASPLHDKDRDACVANWGSIKLMSLTENSMQLAVLRTSCEGPALLVYNYVTKEYSDNYVPPAAPPTSTFDEGFNPKFAPGELLDYLTAASSRLWTLDATGNPIDWIGKGKGWTTGHASSREWGWNNAWDQAVVGSYIKFEKNGLKYTRFQNGLKTTGTFAINESKNEITLSGATLLQNSASSLNPTQTTFKVVKAFPGDVAGKGIWFGTSYDTAKDEWFAFHYILF